MTPLSILLAFAMGSAATEPPTPTESSTPAESPATDEPTPHESWGPEPAPAPAPPVTTPPPVAAPPVQPIPAPAPVQAAPVPSPRAQRNAIIRGDPELSRRHRTAKGLMIGGFVGIGVGAGTLLFVSLPFLAAESVARSRAEGESVLVSQDELLARAERRERVAQVSAVVGGSILLTGVVLAIVGGTQRAAVRRDAEDSMVAFDPRRLTVRF